jgi:hypothetical protein
MNSLKFWLCQLLSTSVNFCQLLSTWSTSSTLVNSVNLSPLCQLCWILRNLFVRLDVPRLRNINLGWQKLTEVDEVDRSWQSWQSWPKLTKLTKVDQSWPKLTKVDQSWPKLTELTGWSRTSRRSEPSQRSGQRLTKLRLTKVTQFDKGWQRSTKADNLMVRHFNVAEWKPNRYCTTRNNAWRLCASEQSRVGSPSILRFPSKYPD